jgi:chromosome segregation ATPase
MDPYRALAGTRRGLGCGCLPGITGVGAPPPGVPLGSVIAEGYALNYAAIDKARTDAEELAAAFRALADHADGMHFELSAGSDAVQLFAPLHALTAELEELTARWQSYIRGWELTQESLDQLLGHSAELLAELNELQRVAQAEADEALREMNQALDRGDQAAAAAWRDLAQRAVDQASRVSQQFNELQEGMRRYLDRLENIRAAQGRLAEGARGTLTAVQAAGNRAASAARAAALHDAQGLLAEQHRAIAELEGQIETLLRLNTELSKESRMESALRSAIQAVGTALSGGLWLLAAALAITIVARR